MVQAAVLVLPEDSVKGSGCRVEDLGFRVWIQGLNPLALNNGVVSPAAPLSPMSAPSASNSLTIATRPCDNAIQSAGDTMASLKRESLLITRPA